MNLSMKSKQNHGLKRTDWWLPRGKGLGREVGVSRCKSFFIRMAKQQYPTL